MGRIRTVLSFAFGLGGFVSFGAPVVLTPAEVSLEFEHRAWRHDEGLPDNRVRAILQTRDGYLWAATSQGLARFDGQKFTVFNHFNTPEFISDVCNALAEDSEGCLWAAAFDALIRKQGNRFTRFTPETGFALASFGDLCPSRDGGVMGGTYNFFGRIHGDQIELFRPSERTVFAVDEEEESGVVWLCTLEDGLIRYDPNQSRFETTPLGQDFERLPAVAICRGADGERWVLFAGPRTGKELHGPGCWLACFKDGRWVRSPDLERPDFVSDWKGGRFIARDSYETLWLPGSSNCLHRFVGGQIQLVPRDYAPTNNYVLCAYSDREGNLWLGTETGGIERWTRRKVVTYTASDGLANDNAWTVCQARDGSVWLGTDGGMTQVKQGGLSNIPLRNPWTQGYVRAIAEDRNGAIWAGTIRNLMYLSNGVLSSVRFPGEWFETKIRSLLPARDGGIWVGIVRGLTLLRDGRRTKYTKADGLGSDEVLALLEDRAGDLWAGTLGGGLSRLHAGRFTTYSKTNGLSSDNVWALHEDADGSLWIGTDNGLNRLNAGHITSFNAAQGLPATAVNCILEDDVGRFWMSHDRGLYWLRKQELIDAAAGRLATVHPVQYGEADGLRTLEFNGQKSFPAGCRTRDGRLWFPSTKGFAVVDPGIARFDEVTPLTVVERIRANGEIVLENGPSNQLRTNGPLAAALAPSPLRLAPGRGRVLEIHYTANTFVAAEKVRFKYRLRGFNKHWIEAGTRRDAYFTGLRPGNYEFEVIACNHHGVWPERGATIPLQLAPFYYQTWWFYTGCAAGFGGLVGLLVTWRVREVRKIQGLERVNALNEQRKQIARDIHDELGASLTHILQISSENGALLAGPEQGKAQTKQIASIAGEAIDNISEIVWANNPKYDTLEDLVAYLREYAAKFFAATSLQVRFDFPDAVPPRRVSGVFRRHLLLLVKEALQNIIKHAAASQVRFRLAHSDGLLELRIADNGRGFSLKNETGNGSADGPHPGNGLDNMRHRVTELNGTFDLQSESGKGTELRVSIPLTPCD